MAIKGKPVSQWTKACIRKGGVFAFLAITVWMTACSPKDILSVGKGSETEAGQGGKTFTESGTRKGIRTVRKNEALQKYLSKEKLAGYRTPCSGKGEIKSRC